MNECNSVEYVGLTYYQKNRDVILDRAKDYYENDKERLWRQARDKYKNLSEEEKLKKENMEKIDIAICLKKRKKRLIEYQRNYREKNIYINIIINKIVF